MNGIIIFHYVKLFRMSIEKQIKDKFEYLLKLENEYNEVYDQLQKIRTLKNEAETDVIQFMYNHNLNKKTFVLNNRKISQRQNIQYQNLSLKFIHQCISGAMGEEQSNRIIELIKDSREKKIKEEIKII